MTETDRNEEIREFVLDNYAPAHQWQPKIAEDWTAWAAENGFLFLCYSEDDKLVGLCIARPLSLKRNLKEITDTDFDSDGELVYVDVTISTSGKQAMQAMMVGILNRMGDKQLIAFKRLRTQDKYNIYRLADFSAKLLRG